MRRWEHAQEGRFYEASVQPDLFGAWAVWRVWGEIDSPGDSHRHRIAPVVDQATGDAVLQRIAGIRERRGYRPVPDPNLGTSRQAAAP